MTGRGEGICCGYKGEYSHRHPEEARAGRESRLDLTSRLNQAMRGERRVGRARGSKGSREGMAEVEGLYGKEKPMSWRRLGQGEELRGARMPACALVCE